MIGVVVPAHNEQEHLGACLTSIAKAARHPELLDEAVKVVVVLDTCSDRSEDIAERHGAICLSINERNVGAARARGSDHLLACGARWLSFTDADTMVSARWLVEQLELTADAVCGTVGVSDWSRHPVAIRQRYEAGYCDADGHRHVHGANLGICAIAYRRAGGFSALATSEDVALVDVLERQGARIAWSAAPRVYTSSRCESRTSGGFGHFIRDLITSDDSTALPSLGVA